MKINIKMNNLKNKKKNKIRHLPFNIKQNKLLIINKKNMMIMIKLNKLMHMFNNNIMI